MNRGGRGRISCTPALQPRLLWLISRGWSIQQAGLAYGISESAIGRQAARDPQFRRRLDQAIAERLARRPVAVRSSRNPAAAMSPSRISNRRAPEKSSASLCDGARTNHLEETG